MSPLDDANLPRMLHSALRHRIAYGQWQYDAKQRLVQQFGGQRADAVGDPDTSSALLRSLNEQRAVLYDSPPLVRHEDEGQQDAMTVLCDAAGVWQLMPRLQRDTLICREMFLHVDADDKGMVSATPIAPHLTEALALPSRPDVPVYFVWHRLRTIDKQEVWTIDIWDIRDVPSFRTLRGSQKSDITDKVHPSANYSGEAYPWRREDGTPFIPVATYHAAKTGALYDPFAEVELVEATLNGAVLRSHFMHCVRDASWPQRYAFGVTVQGKEAERGRDVVVADPSTLLMFVPGDSERDLQPMISQWQASSDPEMLLNVAIQYDRMAATSVGVNPADFARISGDPRSGYSLAISREAQREAARRCEPQFQNGDKQLLSLIASMVRIRAGVALPESGWSVRYQSIPPSQAERVENREQLQWEQERGLTSSVEAWQRLHPGATREEAQAAIIRARLEDAQLQRAVNEALSAANLQEQNNGRRDATPDRAHDSEKPVRRGESEAPSGDSGVRETQD